VSNDDKTNIPGRTPLAPGLGRTTSTSADWESPELNFSSRHNLFAAFAGMTALALGIGASPALAMPAHPWEAIADHYTTLQKANAVAAQARSRGVKTVIQVNGPGKIEVEYANGFATRPPAAAVCAKVKSKGLPCRLGQEAHGVPKAWGHP